MIDIISIYQQHGIPFWTDGKNVSPGWVNVQCPFCEDHSNHCGVDPIKGRCNCWKCGPHYIDELLCELLQINIREAQLLIKENTTDGIITSYRRKRTAKNTVIQLPGKELQQLHINYLHKRNFDPQQIIRDWKITGTGPEGEYDYRIIIPVYYHNKIVTYQGRDVTNKSDLRYKACYPDKEIISIKDICYGMDYIQNRKAVAVEGVFDVWRLGPGAIATFGTIVTRQQQLCIKKHIDYVALLFDWTDPQAQVQQQELGKNLSALGVKVDCITLEGCYANDPAELQPDDAEEIRKNLIGY